MHMNSWLGLAFAAGRSPLQDELASSLQRSAQRAVILTGTEISLGLQITPVTFTRVLGSVTQTLTDRAWRTWGQTCSNCSDCQDYPIELHDAGPLGVGRSCWVLLTPRTMTSSESFPASITSSMRRQTVHL